VNRCGKQNCRHPWGASLAVVSCLVGWPVSVIPAPESAAPVFVIALAVVPLPSELLLAGSRDHDWPKRPELPHTDLAPLVRHREPTDTEVWEHFEAEYRLPNRSPEFVRRQVENAKYGLDKAAFSVDRFVKYFRNNADFDFAQGNVRRTRANGHGGYLDNPRLRLDLDMAHGKPYVGARLVIPFGN